MAAELRSDSVRDGILQAVRTTPGASTREVSRMAGASEWTTDYHLRRMLRAGLVRSESVGRTRCWYVTGCGLCPVLRRALPVLRRPEARAVALAADETPAVLPVLAERAGVPLGATRWLVPLLVRAFLLARSRQGRVFLRQGAQTCVAAASSGRRCDLWGKCAVSRDWEIEQAASTGRGRA
ncbi:MAG TPA: hypothetical protein VM582_05475 [Candidatus Thermoplasmatota archaeon]|nr:hypothetical protein [Candidatus Thermoplasmatota archaeon]